MLLGLVPATIPDAEYSPAAQEWLAIAHAPTMVAPGHNRFHAQVGFQAAADDNMIEFGTALVSDANRVLEGDGMDFDPAWHSPPLDLSPGLAELDFDVVIADPLTWLSDNQSGLHRLVEDNALLLERYRELSSMTSYAFTLTPDYRAPIPNYSSLVKIHRLNSLALAATVVADANNLARLREAMDKTRFPFADSATLIEKMVIASMLRFDLKLYAELLKLPGTAPRHEPFPALDAEERTLRRGYINEFAIGASLLDEGSWNQGMGAFEKLLVGFYFKPRQLQNHTLEHTWMPLLALESLPLGKRNQSADDSAYSPWERFTDPVGYILYEISRPGFSYHDCIEHLDGLITLVNSVASIRYNRLGDNDIAAHLSRVEAGAHPGYAGAVLGFDPASNEIFFKLPAYDQQPGGDSLDRPPRLALR